MFLAIHRGIVLRRVNLRDTRGSGTHGLVRGHVHDKGTDAATRFGHTRRLQRDDSEAIYRQSILVVEDDAEMREQILIPGLLDCGFKDVTGVGNAKETYRAVLTRRFSLFLLDIGLPDESGLTLTRNLREATDSGIVVLTGNQRSKAQHVQGLDDGADAYLLKPVDMELLAATVRSVLRRQAMTDTPVAPIVRASGLDALPLIKKWYPDLTVITISAYDNGMEKQKALTAGAAHFLPKPFDVGKLKEIIYDVKAKS